MNINIVKLIETDQITKLNGNYQNKLIDKIKNNFTDYEQQLFLSSFYCYLKYDPYTDFVIDLDDIWGWIGFSNKSNSKNLLLKYFNENIDYKILKKKDIETEEIIPKKENRGGQNKEIIMLNMNTFKKFCIKAQTKKSDEINDYFIKLQDILFDESNELREKLEKKDIELEEKDIELEEKDIEIDKKNIELKNQKELEREKFLLNEYGYIGSIIYIVKVKNFDNASYIIKIGESRRGIKKRYNEHKLRYDNVLLLDCFKVDKSKDFESFIHNHPNIKFNKVKDLIGHEKENELFLIGHNLTYDILLEVINSNIHKYNYTVEQLLIENELLNNKIEKIEIQNGETQNKEINNDNQPNMINDLFNMIKNLSDKIDNIEKVNKDLYDKINESKSKTNTGFNQQLPTIGARLQKINPDTSILIKVYDTVTEAMNENKNIKRPSIMKAIKENTVYCGYRWLLVERNLDPNIIHDLQPTKQTKIQNIGYIAKINKDKTEILNVYLDRKTAAELNNYSSNSLLDITVKKQKISNGYYYMLYQNCNDDLIFNFENKYGKPILYKNGIGQYDTDNNLLSEFICKYDCIKELKISDKTLNKALKNNVMYNNYYYKELGEKLSVLQ